MMDTDCPTYCCPFCRRDLSPINLDEVESGKHDGYVFVHDEVDHDGNFGCQVMH